ncbi:pyridoxamine 5'-phosphate oxidase family protein [Flavimarina sp. Hel_I_48]|uniref:pyridoxamine 5'-phosphate oxidase family protein n=1 Tax=Flavimarina sp. Hel_I_48 TaxID=1392488 RepID=UPI0004DF5533|nr:pyridoxamine 5'-phosphate oxidase family protein [Flavimarina sp. Hel_I_48]
MGKKYTSLNTKLISFIKKQHLYFVGTAQAEGRVNISPKGQDTLHILNDNQLIWLNLTGSGNESAAHIVADNRMTIMLCSFDKNPLILRMYGTARVYHERDTEFHELMSHFKELPGARQIFKLHIDLVQTSCGFGVPFMDYQSERETLNIWAEAKGEKGIRQYWEDKNQQTIDGFDTHIFE